MQAVCRLVWPSQQAPAMLNRPRPSTSLELAPCNHPWAPSLSQFQARYDCQGVLPTPVVKSWHDSMAHLTLAFQGKVDCTADASI